MIDIGVTKLAIVGAIALIVVGPEKLPALSRTLGTLLGRARRYMTDLKDEVSRSMELDELKKMRESMEKEVQGIENTIQSSVRDIEKGWGAEAQRADALFDSETEPEYRSPKKNWRLKRGATPRWYKVRVGVRTQVQSGAARVARHRPRKRIS